MSEEPNEPFDADLEVTEHNRAQFEADVIMESREILGKLRPEARIAFEDIEEFEDLVREVHEQSSEKDDRDDIDIVNGKPPEIDKSSKEYSNLLKKYGHEFLDTLQFDDFMNGFDACGYDHTLYFKLEDEDDIADRSYYKRIINGIAEKHGATVEEVYNYRREYQIAYDESLKRNK